MKMHYYFIISIVVVGFSGFFLGMNSVEVNDNKKDIYLN